jgi:hypothetical protein
MLHNHVTLPVDVADVIKADVEGCKFVTEVSHTLASIIAVLNISPDV